MSTIASVRHAELMDLGSTVKFQGSPFVKTMPNAWFGPGGAVLANSDVVGFTILPWPSSAAEEADDIVERLRRWPELRYELLSREPGLRSLVEAIAALDPQAKP